MAAEAAQREHFFRTCKIRVSVPAGGGDREVKRDQALGPNASAGHSDQTAEGGGATTPALQAHQKSHLHFCKLGMAL